MKDSETAIGVVAIGQDEGERLERCLRSVRAPGHTLIYVDSGSSAGSVALAERLGAADDHRIQADHGTTLGGRLRHAYPR